MTTTVEDVREEDNSETLLCPDWHDRFNPWQDFVMLNRDSERAVILRLKTRNPYPMYVKANKPPNTWMSEFSSMTVKISWQCLIPTTVPVKMSFFVLRSCIVDDRFNEQVFGPLSLNKNVFSPSVELTLSSRASSVCSTVFLGYPVDGMPRKDKIWHRIPNGHKHDLFTYQLLVQVIQERPDQTLCSTELLGPTFQVVPYLVHRNSIKKIDSMDSFYFYEVRIVF